MSELLAHIDEIRASLAEGESRNVLARRYGVARSTMQDFVAKHATDITASPGSEVRDLDVALAELRDLRSRVRSFHTKDVESERIVREIRDAIAATPVTFAPPARAEGEASGHSQAVLVSDLHAGEVVRPEAVNGLNEFNWDVLTERMGNLHSSLLSYQEHRTFAVDDLQVWFLGDMCSGSNHPEIVETNEFPAAEQGYRVGMMLGQWIEQLLPHFPHITVCGVSGNHPRLQNKPASKNVFNNFDWVAYKIAETYLQQYIEAGRVTCVFPQAGFIVAEIAGVNVLLFHGDGIKSSMPGVPWGGVTRRVNELKKQYAEQGLHLGGFALGHFHQANVVKSEVFMNGSVKGLDEYSLKQFGSGEPPTQLLLTFDNRKHRLTDASFINP